MQRVFFAVFLASLSGACAVRTPGPPAPNPAFEVQPVGTLEGRVTTVNQGWQHSGTGNAAVVTLQLEGNPPVIVQLAPGWYLDRGGLRFSREDRVIVTGSQVHKDKQIEIQAHSIKKGSQQLILRDAQGKPLWSEPDPGDGQTEPATAPSLEPEAPRTPGAESAPEPVAP